MVHLTRILSGYLKGKHAKQSKFIDRLRIFVKGGAGGHGLKKFGGHGGRGGHVYLVASESANLKKLLKHNPTKRFSAGHGEDCRRNVLLGEYGEDMLIQVPPGIVALNDADQVIGEVNKPGDKVLLARGGEGGGHVNRFTGKKGDKLSIKLDLKLIANIGLVGFPNAGKSTLLSALSRASPKIAAYPFTTITPNIGIMQYEDFRQISMADLPGLVEGAHYNVGMGHSFLKHVERTKVLLFVIDMHGFQLSQSHPYRSAVETVLLLNRELELYKEDLVQKPALIALNKIDLAENDSQVEEIVEQLRHIHDHTHVVEEKYRPQNLIEFSEVIPISAKERCDTDKLKGRLRTLLDFYADLTMEEDKKLMKAQEIKLQDMNRMLHEQYSRDSLT